MALLSTPALSGIVVRQRRRRPSVLVMAAGVVAAAVLLPIVFLIIQLVTVGWSGLHDLVFAHQSAQLLWNTVRLAVAVTIAAAVIGTSAAWVIERSDVRFRSMWTVLLVLPLAVPDFVIGFGWTTTFSAFHCYWGALLVMTLDLYPLVYLPVAASFRSADSMQEEVAWGLGVPRRAILFKVTLRQALPSILGGSLLVSLSLFASFGAIQILGYQTFATEIFNEVHRNFSAPGASALSLVVVAMSVVLLLGESAVHGRGRLNRSTRNVSTTVRRHHLGLGQIPVMAGLVLLVALAIGEPVGTLIYWIARGASTTLPATTTLAGALWATVGFSAAAAALAAVLAMPVAFATTRSGGRIAMVLERSTFLVQALPGLVVALSLVFFAVRYAFGIYQTSALLIFAYAVMFFPLALVALRASVSQAPIGLEETARSLGRGRLAVWFRVTLPIIAPGLAAAFSIVFLSAVTELTATLILVPTGVQTLSTEFWAFQSNSAYSAASPYALVTVAVAAGPCAFLARWFDRRPSAVAIS